MLRYRKNIAIIALLIFSIPMGLGNAGIGMLVILVMMPILLSSFNRSIVKTYSIFLVCLVSSGIGALSVSEINIFQGVRSGLPFAIICIMISHSESIKLFFMKAFKNNLDLTRKKIVKIFSAGLLLQSILTILNLGFSNLTLISAESEGEVFRAFVFPVAASILVMFFALINRMYIYGGMILFSLILTGSKAVLLAGLAVIIYAVGLNYKKNKGKRNIKFLISTLGLICMVISVNMTSVNRLIDFITLSNFTDQTRSTQIDQAVESIFKDAFTTLFGNGFISPVKPGIETNDVRWFENSKFDIENGYLMLVAKIGIIGTLLFAKLILDIEKNKFKNALLIIGGILSTASGSVLFNAEGVYLLFWYLFFNANLNVKNKLTDRGQF